MTASLVALALSIFTRIGFFVSLGIFTIRELTRNLVANIVDALSGMYTKLAKKAMGVS